MQYRILQQLAEARGHPENAILVRYDDFAAAGSRLTHDCMTVAPASAAG